MIEENTIKISKKQILRYLTFLFIGILLIEGFFAFTGNSNSDVTGNVITDEEPRKTIEIKTVIQGFQYQPDTITVKKGSKVKLTIQNKDNVLHGLNLHQFGIQDRIQPLSTKTVQFTAVETSTNGQTISTCTQEHGETLTFNVV